MAAARARERTAWRQPSIIACASGRARSYLLFGQAQPILVGTSRVGSLLGDDPAEIINALLAASMGPPRRPRSIIIMRGTRVAGWRANEHSDWRPPITFSPTRTPSIGAQRIDVTFWAMKLYVPSCTALWPCISPDT
jgi:hypothetical protein